MQFTSLAYAMFLPIVFILYWSIPQRFRWGLLLVASYYFYMSWNPKYVVLILFTTAVSYAGGLLLEKKKSKGIVAGCIILCLLVLFFFKYFNFFASSVVSGLGVFGLQLHPITLKVLLPVGISFYTFQTLSYVIDVYRGTVPAEHHFGIYATYVSFFPQLVAGPIERTGNLLPQIKAASGVSFSYEDATYGLKLIAWGLFKKLCIADVVAPYIDEAYITLDALTGFDLAFAVFFFTLQIYCDFSGYSDIAIGTARLLGIRLMTNFRSPYFSGSVKEFWSRWHISLSTWFRDYVYIPLGGNRCSKWKQRRNLMITFLVSGLWHGANWTYVVWGGIHGLAQLVENLFTGKRKEAKDGEMQRSEEGLPSSKAHRITTILRTLLVFAFCNLAWVFFRAQSISDAVYVITHLFAALAHPAGFLERSLIITNQELAKVLLAVMVLCVFDFCSLRQDVIVWVSQRKLWIRWCIYLALAFLLLFLMPYNNTSEFIYFQF